MFFRLCWVCILLRQDRRRLFQRQEQRDVTKSSETLHKTNIKTLLVGYLVKIDCLADFKVIWISEKFGR